MGDAGFYRGTTTEQDSRFADKNKKLLKNTKFAPILLKKVNVQKVNLQILRPWISQKITSLLGIEDEIVINYIFSLLENQTDSSLIDGREMQINLTTFLEQKTAGFMEELWRLIVEASENELGIPKVILEQKKEELRREQMERDRLKEGLMRQKEREESRKRVNANTSSFSRNGNRPSPPPHSRESDKDSHKPYRNRSRSPKDSHKKRPLPDYDSRRDSRDARDSRDSRDDRYYRRDGDRDYKSNSRYHSREERYERDERPSRERREYEVKKSRKRSPSTASSSSSSSSGSSRSYSSSSSGSSGRSK
ncbi:Serine/arginine repetitive matrix protein 1 [Nowakowskiella sp. JEL0407]|nr:Serine/arginine repetitive matrix protein 1 [Nowakowskiella sp. JEL0407]